MEYFPKFLDPRLPARLEGLALRAKAIVEGYVAGRHRSPYHGFSVEFAEHREYAPGDDLRYLDWKVFGRTDKFYLKRFQEETDLTCGLLVDASESMRYRSDRAAWSKWECAQCTAAALAYLVLHRQDRVGLTVFSEQAQTVLRPDAGASRFKDVVQALEAASPAGGTVLGRVLHETAERYRRRGLIVVLSDFFAPLGDVSVGLRHLRHRRHDVIAVQILDPQEMEFSFREPIRFRGLEGFPTQLADPRSLRPAYLREFGRFLAQLRAACRGLSIDYLLVRTDWPLDRVLTQYLLTRAERGRG